LTRSGEATYAWDLENRLVRVMRTDGTVEDLAYDADGHLVQARVTPATGPASVTNFLVDPTGPLAQVVVETDAGGAVRAHYVRGDDLLAVMRPDAGGPAGWSTRFYHADALGSVRLLSSESGAVTDTYDYTAFGELTARAGSDPQPYAFAGEPLDPTTGFQYHRARWMDPRVGRFTGMDPFPGIPSDPSSLHKYAYARANPANVVDPTGLFGLAQMALSVTIMTTVAAISTTLFTLANVAIAGGKPSGWMASLRLNAGARGGLVSGGVDAVLDGNGRVWVSLAVEGGLSPITLFKKHRFGYSGALGPVFNMNHPGELSGLGTAAVWPSSAVRLLLGVLGGKNEAYGVLTRLAQRSARRWVFEFGLSSSGPGYFLVGYYSNAFQATLTYNGDFVPLDQLPDTLRAEVSPVTDAVTSAKGLDTDGTAWGDAFFGILDTLQSP
jgi:RHS repeat-associated protein